MRHRNQRLTAVIGLQANMPTVGLLANQYIALNHEWNITDNYAVIMRKALMYPLCWHL